MGLIPYFDTNRINVENHAKGGISTRQRFMNQGYWQAILPRLKAGDFVILEFGHNDSSELEGPSFRGTIKSIGEESKEVLDKSGERGNCSHVWLVSAAVYLGYGIERGDGDCAFAGAEKLLEG